MRHALDKQGTRVSIDVADRATTYFCPECGEKMVQRHGEILRPCFAHYPNTQCIDNWHYDESTWRFDFLSLFPDDNQEVVLELEGKKHLADVCYEDRKTVIEIQGDRLRQSEFKARNEFFTKLGYHVIWIFDESRPFENEAINYGYRRMGCSRDWTRPSKVFEGFFPQQEQNVEVWFMRSHSDFDEQPRFFRVFCSFTDFKSMECGFCHSLKELMRYLKEGKRTPDYTNIYDIKYLVKRTDGSESICHCPKKPNEPFADMEDCHDCPFRMWLPERLGPKAIGCTYRIEKMDWNIDGTIQSSAMRGDGFVETITVVDVNGEAKQIRLNNPKPFLRTLPELWEKYKPLRLLICYNVETKRSWSVFNPGWQKYKNGVIKGKMVNMYGKTMPGEMEIADAEQAVWFVKDFIKPKEGSF